MLRKPTPDEIQAAVNQTVPDVIAPNLQVLFCGINPSLYSAVVGHHFARPGNRFWRSLHAAGFTHRLFSPAEDRALIPLGYGITNIVDRATATADQLSSEELVLGGQQLAAKARQYTPRVIAILGISAYRTAFKQPKATIGEAAALEDARLWVLPNPSGLNAHYQIQDLAECYQQMRRAIES
jgi:TDG/mug DNA glycosylase family protein